MIIGIDINEANLTSHRVGVNQFAAGLLTGLAKLNTPAQFVLYSKTPPVSDLPPERPGWTYRCLPGVKLWTQTRLPWDLFTHTPRPDVFLSLSHYAPRFCPVPYVISIMDLGFLKFPDQFTAKDYYQLKNWTAYSARGAAKILTISGHSQMDIINTYHRLPADVQVVYPGLDHSFFRPTTNLTLIRKYGLTKPYFLYLSSLKPSKNVPGLIQAFHRFPHSKFQLVIAGKKAWLYDEIFAQVRELHLEDRVVFTGFVPESDIPALMSHAQAFVMPSFYEGFGIPVLEAMATGTPVVVSRVASLPEVAGDAGIYVDPQDLGSIVTGLQTAAGPSRTGFIKKGLKQAKKFDWAVSASQTLSLMQSVA